MWIYYKIERQIRLLCPLKFHSFQTDVYFLTGLVLIFLFCYIYLETIFVSFIPSSEIGKMKSDPFFSRRSVPIRFYFRVLEPIRSGLIFGGHRRGLSRYYQVFISGVLDRISFSWSDPWLKMSILRGMLKHSLRAFWLIKSR